MKARIMCLVAVLAIACVAGCASVDTGKKLNGLALASDGKEIAHVNAQSWGIYFLPIFPLITGNTSSTSGGMAFLMDTCRVEPVVDMATRAGKEMGASRMDDLQSDVTSFSVIPMLIWYKSVQVSGNAIK